MDIRIAGAVQRLQATASGTAESGSSYIGHITLDAKATGERSAGNPHAPFDAAGIGNQFTARLVRHSQRKRGATDRPDLRSVAPVLDPTGRGALSRPRWGCPRSLAVGDRGQMDASARKRLLLENAAGGPDPSFLF